MNYDPEKVTYIGKTDYRNKGMLFGIKAKDRQRHVYVIGKTGMGKSTFLENMAIQDIQSGEGMAFIDPHGSSVQKLLEYVPEHRINDVIFFAPYDADYPISFNIMEDVGKDRRHFVVSGLMSAFKKIWVDAWSARMEYILQNVLFALLEYPGSTLLGVNRMLTDKDYRKRIVDNITDQAVKSFWVDEFAKYTDRFAAEATPAIQNKVGQFVSNPMIRNIIGQPKSSFDFRTIMDDKKILIMDLSKGRLGEGNTNLIGSMLITKIYLSAMSRADVPADVLAGLPNFYFYVDEFQSFANESFADILSEARKYKLNLTIAHQYIEQMPEEVRSAVFGNVGTMVTFRVGAYDAEFLEKEYAPEFMAQDLVNLGFAQAYMKLMIDGIGCRPFSATGVLPPPPPQPNFKDVIIEASRKNFAKPRAEVEAAITKWYEPVAPLPRPAESRIPALIIPQEGNGAPLRGSAAGTPFRPSQNAVPQSAQFSNGMASPAAAPQKDLMPARLAEHHAQHLHRDAFREHSPSGSRPQLPPDTGSDRSADRRSREGAHSAPLTHSPFKQALLDAIKSGAAVEITQKKEPAPQSIQPISPFGGHKKESAPAESSNRNALKDALAKAMIAHKEEPVLRAASPAKHVDEVEQKPSPERVFPKDTARNETTKNDALNDVPKSAAPREIPESDLRTMLAVDLKKP